MLFLTTGRVKAVKDFDAASQPSTCGAVNGHYAFEGAEERNLLDLKFGDGSTEEAVRRKLHASIVGDVFLSGTSPLAESTGDSALDNTGASDDFCALEHFRWRRGLSPIDGGPWTRSENRLTG